MKFSLNNNTSLESFEENPKESTDKTNPARDQWGSRLEFLLSCVGLSVGIGNIWRFPYLAYKNGGAAFLIPYTILLIFVGKPIFFLEVALGQFSSSSAIAVWRCCPIGKGIGIAMSIVCIIACIYYNVLIAYTVFYTAASFAKEVPWKDCFSWWGPDYRCFVRKPDSLPLCSEIVSQNTTNTTLSPIACETLNYTRQTAAEQYWNRYVLHLHESDGIEDIGGIRWELALCLLFAWIIVFICLSKGIKSSGKVVYVTATFPYLILLVLLIRGVTLEGASVGLRYLFIPDWSKLLEIKVWQAAAEQMFFSLGTSWGCLIMFGSYNPFRNKVHIDSLIVSFTDFATSLIGCVAIFSVLGHLSQQLNLNIENVATAGPGLAFVVYPEALALLPVSQLWSVLFFVMLFTLGLDSQFAMLESVLSNIYDRWPYLIKYKTLATFGSCFLLFLLGLSCVTNGGQYVFNIMDAFGPAQSVLIIALVEIICLMWIYGVRRIIRDIEFMLNTKLSVFWLISWGVICPLFLLAIVILSIVYYEPLTYNEYNYPDWALMIGWLLEAISICQIPIWAFIMTFLYWKKGDIMGVFRPTKDWGPADKETRKMWRLATQKPLSGVVNPAFSSEKFDSVSSRF